MPAPACPLQGLVSVAAVDMRPQQLAVAHWEAVPDALPVVALAYVYQNVVPVITVSMLAPMLCVGRGARVWSGQASSMAGACAEGGIWLGLCLCADQLGGGCGQDQVGWQGAVKGKAASGAQTTPGRRVLPLLPPPLALAQAGSDCGRRRALVDVRVLAGRCAGQRYRQQQQHWRRGRARGRGAGGRSSRGRRCSCSGGGGGGGGG